MALLAAPATAFTVAGAPDSAPDRHSRASTVQTSIGLTSITPNPSVFGEAVQLTATISQPAASSPPACVDGSVAFALVSGTTSTPLGTSTTPGAGAFNFSATGLPRGADKITATYAPSAADLAAGCVAPAAATITQQVGYPTSLTVGSVPNPSAFGAQTMLTASVDQISGTPDSCLTGTVVFTTTSGSGELYLGQTPLVGGDAAITTSSLPLSSDTVTATFTPDAADAAMCLGSTGTLAQQVVNTIGSTQTGLTTSPNPSDFGQAVQLTATVSQTGSTGFACTAGTIHFTAGVGVHEKNLGTLPINGGGPVTLTTVTIPAGIHLIFATFIPTPTEAANCAGSAGVVTQEVGHQTVTELAGSQSGQKVTLKATITDPSAPPADSIVCLSGTVTFTTATSNGELTLGARPTVIHGTGINARGVATLVTKALAPGADQVTATFTPDNTNHCDGSTATITQQVFIPTKTALTANPASPTLFGQSVVLTATVTQPTGTGTACLTGTVAFTVGTAPNQTALGSTSTSSNGVFTLTTSALPTGNPDTVTATFSPTDTPLCAGSVGTLQQKVKKDTTTTMLTATPNPSMPGQNVQLAATVIQPAGTGSACLTGTVLFTLGVAPNQTTLGTVSTTGGVATLNTSTLPLGSDTITAAFTPNDGTDCTTSTDSVVQVVSLSQTKTVLTASPNPSAVGANVTFTATVTQITGTGTGCIAGSVVFTLGVAPNQTTLGTVSTTGGVATLTVNSLPQGADTITAMFSPSSAACTGGTSATWTQQVNNGTATTTVLTATPNPSVFGDSVTLNAAVTQASAGDCTAGKVLFTFGNTTLGSGSVSTDANGMASVSTSTLPPGDDQLTATFTPNDAANCVGSVGTFTETINPDNTHTALTATPNPTTFGQSVTLTATVTQITGPGNACIMGLVTFTTGIAPNLTTLGSQSTNGNGVATLTTTDLPGGTDVVSAAFVPTDATDCLGSVGTVGGGVVVNAERTHTALHANTGQAEFDAGDEVHLTANVSQRYGTGAECIVGTVVFAAHTGAGDVTIGTRHTNPVGAAYLEVPNLPSGTDGLTAAFTPSLTGDCAGSVGHLDVPAATAVFPRGRVAYHGLPLGRKL
jgi:hypothetical protein